MMEKKRQRKKAGTVTVKLVNASAKSLDIEFSVSRKRGKPSVVPLKITGHDAARVLAVLNDPTVLDPDWKPKLFTDPRVAPKVGDVIYVRTSCYIDHGEDDVMGGLAHVVEVKPSMSAGEMVPFVSTREHPGRSYNWALLAPEQERMSRDYGVKWAYPDPER